MWLLRTQHVCLEHRENRFVHFISCNSFKPKQLHVSGSLHKQRASDLWSSGRTEADGQMHIPCSSAHLDTHLTPHTSVLFMWKGSLLIPNRVTLGQTRQTGTQTAHLAQECMPGSRIRLLCSSRFIQI